MPTPYVLTRKMTLLFALASGTIIGNIYYSQPLLAALASTFGYTPAHLGFLVLPQDQRPRQQWHYPQLSGSLLTLLRQHPTIALRSWYGALGYACFSMFWTGLTFLLSAAPYHYSEAQIGAFGLAGAAGALAARLAGPMADRG